MLISTRKYLSKALNDKEELYKLLACIGAVLFFAKDFNTALFVRIFEFIGFDNDTAIILKAFIPLIFALPLTIKRFDKSKTFFKIYLIIAIYFAISFVLKPNNIEFFFIDMYGIDKVFLPSGGVFAILFINLLYDKEDYSYLYYTFLVTALLIGALSILQYISAAMRGYWTTTNYIGEEIKINYSLTFGFNVALMINIFSAFYMFTKKKIFLIPIVIGYMGIIEAGNRMALALPLMFVFVYFVYSLINLFKNKSDAENKKDLKRIIALGFIFVITFAFLFVINFISIKMSGDLDEDINIKDEISGENIKDDKSRNLNLLGSGNILEQNGRDRISKASMRCIKSSPILGKGAYGDRECVFPVHHVGFSHNFFLEVWSNLGLLLGIPLAIYLLNTLIFMLNQNKSFILLIYFSFLATAVLHMTSLSFWIAFYLWTLIGISIVLMKKEDYWIYNLYRKIRK